MVLTLFSLPKSLRDRYMEQVVSSAIANPPPPEGVLTVMNYMGGAGRTNDHTRHEMCRIFDTQPGLPAKQMLNRRNWCEVFEYPVRRVYVAIPAFIISSAATVMVDSLRS